jgi:hypothetical protein
VPVVHSLHCFSEYPLQLHFITTNPIHISPSAKMRYAFAITALAAIGAQALPQESSYDAVQPITQISDGQIQAPPATYVPMPVPSAPSVPSVPEVPEVPEATEVVPTPEVPVVVVPSPTEAPTVPVVVPPVGDNSTAIVTTVPSNSTITTGSPTGSPTSPEESSPTGAPEETGAAAASFVSFGGVALAVAGFFLA